MFVLQILSFVQVHISTYLLAIGFLLKIGHKHCGNFPILLPIYLTLAFCYLDTTSRSTFSFSRLRTLCRRRFISTNLDRISKCSLHLTPRIEFVSALSKIFYPGHLYLLSRNIILLVGFIASKMIFRTKHNITAITLQKPCFLEKN